MKHILVVATAMRIGGALSILNQFIEYASNEKNLTFEILVDSSFVVPLSQNCHFVKKDTKNWFRRLAFDSFYLNRYIKKSNKQFNYVISLQNTTVRTNLKQFVYVHQPLPFSDFKGNFFTLTGLKLYSYKYFYKTFIYLYSREDTHFIVQTHSMAQALNNKWEISVYRPKVESINKDENVTVIQDRIFYPSSPISYKNHNVILEALSLIDKDVEFLVTFHRGENQDFDKLVIKLKIENNIRYLGHLSREKINYYYNSSELIVFPSTVETFGLPLIEAASIGKPIVCADVGYARDVIGSYEGVSFVNPYDIEAWAEHIINNTNNKIPKIYAKYENSDDSWKEFFSLF